MKLPKSFVKKISIFFLVLIAIFIVVFFINRNNFDNNYALEYTFVPEKVSQSANIRINLPTGVDKETAKNNISFDPEIKGNWVEEENVAFSVFASEEDEDNILYFNPDEDLELNKYYALNLNLGIDRSLSAFFVAVEDPKIIRILPEEGTEASEYSKVSILFNRPMVPLTTLDVLGDKDIPVEIIPETKGKFKWISTNTLQFIPEDRLQFSSNYTIKVRDGFESMDGLTVEPIESHFVSKKLRYSSVSSGTLIYNEPIRLYFNQDVDLNKTMNEVELVNTTTGKTVKFTANYKGEDKGLNLFASLFKSKEEVDKSVIEIYNYRDEFNRKNFWDFEDSYVLTIPKVYPMEGDTNIDQEKVINFKISSVVKSIEAESDNTSYVGLDFFDKAGSIVINFYEPISISKSVITSDRRIQDFSYGKKCSDFSLSINDSNCEKIDDHEEVIIKFQESDLKNGDNFNIYLKKIVNDDGLTVNPTEISRNITVYNDLDAKIYYEDLSSLVICSNNPLTIPASEDIKDIIKSNMDYSYSSFSRTYQAYNKDWDICAQEGWDFRTYLNLGLMPEKDYDLSIKVEDVFSQEKTLRSIFKSGVMESFNQSIYDMQQEYSITSPNETELYFGVRNITTVNVEVCKFRNIKGFIDNLYKDLYYTSTPFNYNTCESVKYDTIDLPEKYWIPNYFSINLKDFYSDVIGNYAIRITSPEYDRSIRQGFTFVNVTNLALAEKRIEPASYYNNLSEEQLSTLENLYLVTGLTNGNPVKGAEVIVYTESGSSINIGKTDKEGILKANPIYGIEAVYIEKDGDSTMTNGYESRLESGSYARNIEKIYIYKDRPIYKPSDEVNIKAILRLGYDGDYQMLDSETIRVSVYDSGYDEVFEEDVEIDEFGTINTSFILKDDARLGSYRIRIGDYTNTFDVQEYVAAAFEVSVDTDKDEYISKDDVKINIDSNYYFGVPVSNAEVEYTVISQNYYFNKYNKEYFKWNTSSYYSYSSYYNDEFISRGSLELDEDGKGVINENFDFEQLFGSEDSDSKIITVEATVKNNMGQSVSGRKSFVVHKGEFYLGLKTSSYFVKTNEDFELKIKSVDVNANALRVSNIDVKVYSVDWVYAKRKNVAGTYSYEWEQKKDLVREFKANTNNNGDYASNLSIEEGGVYEIEISAKDDRGNIVRASKEIYVSGYGGIRYDDDSELELVTENTSLEIGATGEIVIKSPYENAKALISIERGKIFEYEVVDIDSNLYKYSFNVKEDYYSNIYVSVLLQNKGSPEVKFGSLDFDINSEIKNVNIEFESVKSFYEPGEDVEIVIKTTDYENKPISASVSLSVVDLSVLALKGNEKKDPIVFFYNGFPLTVDTHSNLKSVIEIQEAAITNTKGGGGGDSVGNSEEEARGEFEDTAFWKADIITDENGYAKINFTLPDNLTTWQAEALGVTKDTKVGVSYIDFMTKQNLMIVPLKPRFIIPSDEFYIGAQIFNQDSQDHQFDVRVESDTLEFLENNKNIVSIPKEGSTTVYFKVKAPSEIGKGYHTFTIYAEDGELEDAVFQAIKINSNLTYEATATASYTTKSSVFEAIYLPSNIDPEKGELTINSSATLAVFLSDALNYLIGYPYGCAEQISSRLKAIAILKAGLNVPNLADKFDIEEVEYNNETYTIDELVQIGLSKIYSYQNYNGGFSYWGNGSSSYYLTLKVLDALNYLKRADYNISESVIDEAAEYVMDNYNGDKASNTGTIMMVNTLMYVDSVDKEVLRSHIANIVLNDNILKDDLSNQALATVAVIVNYLDFSDEVKNKINNYLDNRISIDARGAFLDSPYSNYYYYASAISNTAEYLKSLVVAERETGFNDKVLRWLLNARNKDGNWGSTINNLAVIDAFTDYLNYKNETNSNFNLKINLNNEEIAETTFSKDNILEQAQTILPIKDIERDKLSFVEFNKSNLWSGLYYDLSLKYYLNGNIASRDEGFTITKSFYSLNDTKNENPLTSAKTGDVFKAHIEVIVPETRRFVSIEDFIPAGIEIINMDYDTEQQSLYYTESERKNRILYPDFEEIRDDRYFLYEEYMRPGVYEFDYYVRALVKGEFMNLPSVAMEMYNPEIFGRTSSSTFIVE
jgi:uncharacterized protein YfaS (alpha-2-macroglobulin family)